MKPEQTRRTENYKGMHIHVDALSRKHDPCRWDYIVRVAQPVVDANTVAELAARAGDEDDYGDAEQAMAAGLKRGQAMVDRLTG